MNTLEALALSVSCPHCGAAIFKLCFVCSVPSVGLRRVTPHQERVDAALGQLGHAKPAQGDLPEIKELEKSDGK